jgi:hypothetical protein
MRSPVSVTGVESVISDIESTISLGNSNGITTTRSQNSYDSHPTAAEKAPERPSKTLVETGLLRPGDGDAVLEVCTCLDVSVKH